MLGGLFGGKTQVGSNATTQNTQNTTVYDSRIAAQDSQIFSGNGNSQSIQTTINNTTTDFGAIRAAADQVLAAISSNSSTVSTVAKLIADSTKDSNENNLKIINSSYQALGEKDHITADLVKQYGALQSNATNAIGSAWENAKNFEANKSMGDLKYVMYGFIAVIGVMAIWGRK